MPATNTATTLAAAPVTVSYYVGYGLPNKEITTTLGDMLGADHIAWICEQPYPHVTATSRARGMWDSNQLEMVTAYSALAKLLEAA